MGYILPVTHHTYHAYQKRMEEEKASPHHIRQAYRVTFPKLDASLDHLTNNDHPYYDQQQETNKRAVMQKEFYQVEHRQKAAITGKGGIVNAEA